MFDPLVRLLLFPLQALNARSRREELPTRITPELVHRMLQQLRHSAEEVRAGGVL
jgi:hypothetical protein